MPISFRTLMHISYCCLNSIIACSISDARVCISGMVKARSLRSPTTSPLCSLRKLYLVSSIIFNGRSLYEMVISWFIRNWPKHAANRKNRLFLSASIEYCRAGKRSRYFFKVAWFISYMIGVSTSIAPIEAERSST